MKLAQTKQFASSRGVIFFAIFLLLLAFAAETLSIRRSFLNSTQTYSTFESVILPDLILGTAVAGIVLVLVGSALRLTRVPVRTHIVWSAVCFLIGWLTLATGPGDHYYTYDALLAAQWVALIIFGPWFLILAGVAVSLRLIAARRSGRVAPD